MPIDTPHPSYEKNLPLWSKCRDVVDGEEAVKAAGDKYLPALGGCDTEEYDAYKARALFYSATQRTVKALAGAIFSRPFEMEFPESKDDLLKTFGVEGEPFTELAKRTVEEVIATGRIGLYVDADASQDDEAFEMSLPYVSTYFAENIINWRFERIKGVKVLSLVVLKECYEDVDADGFKTTEEERYRVLRLQDGVFTVEVWEEQDQSDRQRDAGQEKFIKVSTITPTLPGGKKLDYIPFTFIGPTGITGACENPPILGLVNVNLSHYRTSADLEHGRHFTALPTAWASGFDTKQPFRIGSSVAWVTSEPNARAGFLEFTGAGLGHLAEAIKEKEHMMAVLGARLLEDQKRAAETAEAITLRQTGESSALNNIAMSVSSGLTKVLGWYATWAGITEEVEVELNTDFGVTQIDAPTLTALMSAVQSNMMSWDLWFYNLKRGGLVPDATSADDEREAIIEGPPVRAIGKPTGEPGMPGAAGPGNPAKPGFPAPKPKAPVAAAGAAQAKPEETKVE